MLRHGGELLIQQKFEAIVVRLDERMAPQIWLPMPHRKNQANEFTLVRRERRMAGGQLLAEERD
jgi:hypothetical protein